MERINLKRVILERISDELPFLSLTNEHNCPPVTKETSEEERKIILKDDFRENCYEDIWDEIEEILFTLNDEEVPKIYKKRLDDYLKLLKQVFNENFYLVFSTYLGIKVKINRAVLVSQLFDAGNSAEILKLLTIFKYPNIEGLEVRCCFLSESERSKIENEVINYIHMKINEEFAGIEKFNYEIKQDWNRVVQKIITEEIDKWIVRMTM
ncbi:hypothetical protein [Bacillus cereus]|uniref:hypothetical protein n=1 Tax=Bacillus cereus TaxID=1396 RepID=UPI000B4B2201|nr:hypothetical protein [Bacillus cereus]